MANAVQELDLLISLFEKDGSGKLLPGKELKKGRTFDEDNVFSSYSFFIYRLAEPSKPDRHRDAYQAVLTTHGKYTPKQSALLTLSDALLISQLWHKP
jgi:hypothetical protein